MELCSESLLDTQYLIVNSIHAKVKSSLLKCLLSLFIS
jgi:hypothetical protein